ncbi:MAG: hypothetical protein VX185_02680 [Pseudomonadota bacterium]|nr:hypothetical protein [Pseudomonadota bacterium]
MTQPRQHEYPYPFNAWITQVLPLRDFVEAFVASTRNLKQSNPEKWPENRQLQYTMLMEMVYTFELPREVAEQVWQPFADEILLEETAIAQSQTAEAQIETAAYGEEIENTPRKHAPLKQPQSRIAQQIQEQKEKAAKRDAIATGSYQPARKTAPKPQQDMPIEPKAQAPRIAADNDIADKIAKAKAKKAEVPAKKGLYTPEQDNEPQFSSFSSVDDETQDYAYSEPQRSTIKSRARYQHRAPEPVAKPKSRKGLFFVIFLLIAVNAVLVAAFVLPQFSISEIFAKITGQATQVENRDPAGLSALDDYADRHRPGSAAHRQEEAKEDDYDPDSAILPIKDRAAEPTTEAQPAAPTSESAERAALLKQMESANSTASAPAQQPVQQSAPAVQQATPAAQESGRNAAAVRAAYAKLVTQAGDLNLEPATESDTALHYLKEMVDAGATSDEIANAHAALDRGFTALSKLAKAQGQSIESQRLLNQAMNHENLANRYRNQ